MNSSHTRRVESPRFERFAQFPLEIQCRIWELACPGPRLIEVYPRPRGWNFCDEIVGYKWLAYRCDCESNCNSPLTISHVCRESRRIFRRLQGTYTKCFDTIINWERDILYIGDRAGHLHNAEFLKTVELAGGLGKVKNLAIYEDTWMETKNRHGNQSQEFKRCGPVAVVQQLGVKNLTIVGKAGFFRDGSEFWNEVDERAWLWNSDSELDDYNEQLDRGDRREGCEDAQEEETSDESEDGEFDEGPETTGDDEDGDLAPAAPAVCGSASGAFRPLVQPPVQRVEQPQPQTHLADSRLDEQEDADDESGQDEAESDSSSEASSDSSVDSYDAEDRWECNGPIVRGEDPRIYKPRYFDWKLESRKIPTGESGMALVDFTSIPGRPIWDYKSSRFRDAASIKQPYLDDFADAKRPHQQYYGEDDDPESPDFIDWASWTPPALSLAFFRRTGQSCFVNDWNALNQDYISWKVADKAKRNVEAYIDLAVRRGHYQAHDLDHLASATEFGGMEGYGAVEDYIAEGMEIPCTATTREGKSYAPGNYMNCTKKVKLPSIFGDSD